MIRSFKHRGLKRFYERYDRSGIRSDFADTIQEILTVLDDAAAPRELDLPGYRLHPLKGDLKRVLVSYRTRELANHISVSRAPMRLMSELIDYH
jgi:plasmid maintenance system killer protein